jgi:hypothetical protein
MMSVDTGLANSLLNKKYDSDGMEIKTSTNLNLGDMRNPTKLNRQNTTEVDWKFIASERLQMMTELQDAKNAWWEAWKLEKERADRLEAKLFSYMDGFVEEISEVKEVKHTTSSPAQVSRRRANWPSIKARLEKKFSLSENPIEDLRDIKKGETQNECT